MVSRYVAAGASPFTYFEIDVIDYHGATIRPDVSAGGAFSGRETGTILVMYP
jgi:hypothetical protein